MVCVSRTQNLTFQGVHVGHCGVPRTRINKAVSFQWHEVWDLLHKFDVVGGKRLKIQN